MTSRIGVDIGGTFTDLVYYDAGSGTLVVEKVPSTPARPEIGCIDAIHRAVSSTALRVTELFLHGTTVGLNALLERRGAAIGLLTTTGFRDILEIGRGSRQEAYNLSWKPPVALVPRSLRLPIRERTWADGTCAILPDEADVTAALKHFRTHNVESVAVVFLNAYANPANELAVEAMLRTHGFDGDISLSHRIVSEYGEFERASTTVIDAFVRPRMAQYLDRIEGDLTGSGFDGTCLLMRSGSGSMSFDEARERPFESIMSGPVAGAEGAAELARELGLGDLITADVGGTSFDTCVILNGRPQQQFEGQIGGMPLKASWVDVRSIGAGGGSVAYIDSGGGLRVGPRSSGALPGPACYGRGGEEPCVTDAAFYLGMLGEGHLASGLQLSHELATSALQSVATGLALSIEQTARGILEIASVSMANAIREVTVEQGLDPRQMKLLSFGGAGPLLATLLAQELSIDEIVVPMHAGNFSAWGLLGAGIARSASVTKFLKLDERVNVELRPVLVALLTQLQQRGANTKDIGPEVRTVALDMRYHGQEHSLTVEIPTKLGDGLDLPDAAEIRACFEGAYRRTFGSTLDHGIEIVTVRISTRQELPRRAVSSRPEISKDHGTTRKAASFATGDWKSFRIVQRDALVPGEIHHGPAVIHELTTTTYVDANFSYNLDESGCLRLKRVQSSQS